VLKALYYLAPGVLVVGLLQARRERKPNFQVPGVMAEDVVGELESECLCSLRCPLYPVAGGFVPLL
jgi:hypothetical protein